MEAINNGGGCVHLRTIKVKRKRVYMYIKRERRPGEREELRGTDGENAISNKSTSVKTHFDAI